MTGPDRPETAAAASVLAAIARRLAAAARLAPLSSGPAAGDKALTGLSDIAVVALDAQAASIAVHDPAGDRLVFVAAAGPAAAGVVGLAIDAESGIAGYAFSTGQPLAVSDVTSDARFDRTIADATGYVPRTILATPVMDEQATLGVLEVLDRHGDVGFSLRDLDVAARLAAQVATVIRAGQLDRDAAALLRRALTALASDVDGALDEATIERLVRDATLSLANTDDDAVWRLADSLARLRTADPGSVELAAEWIEVLVRRAAPDRGRLPR